MVNALDSQTRRFLADLERINEMIERAQGEISSGRRVRTISDAPDEISHLLALRSDLNSITQIKDNLGRVKTEVDTAETTLAHAVELLDRIQVLATQGASDLTDPAARRTLGGEVEQLAARLVTLSNTQVEGRFLFSGDQDQSPAYTVDFSADPPITPYLGSASTRQVQHPSGPRFPVARTAEQIFDPADGSPSVFDSVLAVRTALLADDAEGVRTALQHVRAAATHLNSELARYGGTQNQVAEALEFASKQEVRLKGQIAEIEDADVAAAILELRDGQFHQEAALAAQGSRPRRTLWDYLR